MPSCRSSDLVSGQEKRSEVQTAFLSEYSSDNDNNRSMRTRTGGKTEESTPAVHEWRNRNVRLQKVKQNLITEKSSFDAAEGKYTFQVAKTATKTDVRKAVEQLFEVKVVAVNTVNYDGKKKRQRYVEGTTPAYKKAVVTIDTEGKDVSYLGKGGKAAKSDKKYKTAIEEFGIGQ